MYDWSHANWRHKVDVNIFVISKAVIIFVCSTFIVMIKFRLFFIVFERRSIDFVFYADLIRLLWFIEAIKKIRSIELIILKINFKLKIILFELLLKVNDRSKLKLLIKLKIDALSKLKKLSLISERIWRVCWNDVRRRRHVWTIDNLQSLNNWQLLLYVDIWKSILIWILKFKIIVLIITLIIDEITSLQIVVILILIVDVNIKSILIVKKKRRWKFD